jgi:glycine zipper 2TM protein
MKRLILAFAALGAVSACSDSRDRNIPVVEEPDRPLRVARPDTSDKVAPDIASRGNQPVSPIEQQATRPEPSTKARAAPRSRKAAAARPKPPVDTASTRGYAPTTNADTATSSDTVVADTSSPQPPDTTRAANRATAPALPSDTVATAQTDTVPTDTAAVSSDSAVASSATSAAPPAASGIDDAALRTLPIGTEIHAALDDSISSRRDSAGRSITAQISESVTGPGGRVLIPAGSTVQLTVVQLASAKSKSSQGRLAFRVDGIEVSGRLQKVQADVRPVPRELRGRGVTTGDAAKVGVGAVGGAVLGRVIGGNSKGAVIGGVAGAAGGAVVASQTATRDVVVKAKTPVTLVLTAPVVTP